MASLAGKVAGVALALLSGLAASAQERTRFGAYQVRAYELELRPDPGALSFEGTVTIAFATGVALPAVELNAADLSVEAIRIDDRPAAGFTLDSREDLLKIALDQPLAPGEHRLAIAYRGAIQRSAFGLFAMDYQDGGVPARALFTDLEPDDARRLLPCWDVPAAKATFRVRVLAPPGQTALSNMPVEGTGPLASGATWFTFQTTPKMSTYLLFLGVGRFQRRQLQVEGVDLGLVTVAGSAGQGEFALAEAARVLPFYNRYFGLPYPLPKLDLIAAPGAITSVAMENWGAILVSENALLRTGPAPSAAEDRTIFATLAHELSHQWFGNLVTMAWWDDLWLNEGFASWMDMKATAAFHPEWEIWLTDGASDKEAGMNEDEKASAHPIVQPIGSVYQAEQSFDMITYKKGMATVQMLERYLGEEDFRKGVRAYLAGHAYGHATSGDLWAELERASGEPVVRVMRSYTRTAGVPMVEVRAETPTPDGQTRVTLRRTQYAERARPRHPIQVRVPLLLRAADGAGQTRVLLEDGRPHDCLVPGTGPVLVNAGQNSYVRVFYATGPLARLRARFATLPAADQLGLIYDTWAFTRSSLLPPGRLLELLEALPAAGDPVVWQKAIEILERIDHLHGDAPGRATFRAFARRLLMPVARRVGWTPATGEAPPLEGLRATVMEALSRFGDPGVQAEVRAFFQAGPPAGLAEPWPAILAVTAQHADPATFEALVALARNTGPRLNREKILNALTEVQDPALALRLLDLALGDLAPGGMGPLLVMAIGEQHPDLTWNYVLAHLDRMPQDSDTPLIFVPSIAEASIRPSRALELDRYTRARVPLADRHTSKEIMLAIRFNARIAERVIPRLDAWCAALVGPVGI